MSQFQKIAVVTGSNKGIGYEIAGKLGSAGFKTIIACRNPALGEEAASSLRTKGYDAEFRQVDISDFNSIKAFSEVMGKEYGRCDVLVNNAAMAFKAKDPTPFPQQAEPTIHTNFFGTLEMSSAMLPLLKSSSSCSRIVNIASMVGHLRLFKDSEERKAQFTSPALTIEELKQLMSQFVSDAQTGVHAANGWPSSCYGMSKLAVIAMTKVMARENPEMSVTACCPGYCDTDMTSHKGPRPPEHGARTAAMLAMMSDDQALSMSGKFFENEEESEW
eukprot:CAMPEP_0182418754 /NCGR_PEP_ID=MMETSP1167-20130531/3133_1 /TAXON_ID=2988 /ORGANISM="Mallomonas Sp, Strain CCMP3275" /LENGTH=274 /DNA_ID=CAMNT_0024593119 /DNA_START=80 /DNA_END=901 /DNA_ORIENTATION=+